MASTRSLFFAGNVISAFQQAKGLEVNEKVITWSRPLRGRLELRHFKQAVVKLGLQLNPNFLKAGEIMRERIIDIKEGERRAKELGLLTKDGRLVFDIATGINAEVVEVQSGRATAAI